MRLELTHFYSFTCSQITFVLENKLKQFTLCTCEMGDNQSGGAHVNCVEIFLTVVSGQLRLMIKNFLIF